MVSKKLFKFIAIFFRLMNSLVIFQINTRKVTSFIDNVIVRMKKEEEHNKVVEEIVRRLTENDIYI